MSVPKFTEVKALHEAERSRITSSSIEHVSKGLGAYGAVINILVAAKYFTKKEYGQGALSLAQAVHAVGGLRGWNKVASEF